MAQRASLQAGKGSTHLGDAAFTFANVLSARVLEVYMGSFPVDTVTWTQACVCVDGSQQPEWKGGRS